MPSFGPDPARSRRALLAFLLVVPAASAATSPASPSRPSAPPSHAIAACKASVAAFVRKNAIAGQRLVFTFTGTQEALTPFSEAIAEPPGETAYFPIDRGTFVVTLQVRVQNVDLGKADYWAGRLCGLLPAKGARYNGALAISGNRMVDADMAPLGPIP
ncbi:MAG: hypothetical protein ACJ8DZ_05795 [Allosphingosinicella sp.]